MTTLTKAAQDLLEKMANLTQCCIATREVMLSDRPWEAQLMQTEVLAKEAKTQLVALGQTAGFPENLPPEIRSRLKELLAAWNIALENLHLTAKDLFHKTEASINEEF